MADSTIDTRPQTVDIAHYGGDTLTIEVDAPEALTAGMAWSAQIRADRESAVDASFVITPPTPPATVAVLVLPAAEVRRLMSLGAPGILMRRTRTGPAAPAPRAAAAPAVKYTGVWDCELHHPSNPDPVVTIVQGTLTLDMDVTRQA